MRALQAFISASFYVSVVAIRIPIVFAIYVGKSAQLLKFRVIELVAGLLLDLGSGIVILPSLPTRTITHPTAHVAGGQALRLPPWGACPPLVPLEKLP